MNLVAKEFVAARADESGALVLSEFAGAAAELRQAYVVNPYDRRALKDALCRAVEAPSNELADRMRQMRAYLRGHDVWDWARAFLAALDEARARDG
jgi:trehalose 6-phosphate synthase